jgi:hypothetical protein
MEAAAGTVSVFATTRSVPGNLNFAGSLQDRGAFWPRAAPVNAENISTPENATENRII